MILIINLSTKFSTPQTSQSCVKKMLIFCLKHADVFKKYADVFLKIC